MNRRLVIMRHAKSSWSDDTLSDHARPLNKRGQRESPEVARELIARGWVPQLVLSSDSKRTRQTWEIMATVFDDEIPVQWLESLYHAGINEVCQVLEQIDPLITDILLLGHNPGWEGVVNWLSGQYETMTTANAALLQCQSDTWIEALEHHTWDFVDIIRPREL